MMIPLFQILKDDEKNTVGASKVSELTNDDAVAMVLALLEAARKDKSVDNMVRIVANTRRYEAPDEEVDSTHIFMDVSATKGDNDNNKTS